MQRVTMKDLEAVVTRLNRMTNSPLTSYTKVGDTYVANIGNYHLDGAYGGWALHRMQNEGGGITDVLQCGHVSKRELIQLMHAYIRGIESKEASQ